MRSYTTFPPTAFAAVASTGWYDHLPFFSTAYEVWTLKPRDQCAPVKKLKSQTKSLLLQILAVLPTTYLGMSCAAWPRCTVDLIQVSMPSAVCSEVPNSIAFVLGTRLPSASSNAPLIQLVTEPDSFSSAWWTTIAPCE